MRARPTQLAAARHRADGDDRLASPVATSASSPRCRTCSSARRSPATSSMINHYLVRDLKAARPVDRRAVRERDQAPRKARSRPSTRFPKTYAVSCTARLGSYRMRALIDLAAARGAVRRPEPVPQPVHGHADDRQALVDVRSMRGRSRAEDDLLPALPTGYTHPPDHGGGLAGSSTVTDEEAVACSLENPESCEACQ